MRFHLWLACFLILSLLALSVTADHRCSGYKEVKYGGANYYMSKEKYHSWRDADNACNECFNYGLGDVKDGMKQNGKHEEVYVGSYKGGPVVEDLVWYTRNSTNDVAVSYSHKPYKGLCGKRPPPKHSPNKDRHQEPYYYCRDFSPLRLDGEDYWLSYFPVESWSTAYELCKVCFGKGLGDISNDALRKNYGYKEFFVGSYDGGLITKNLVWNLKWGTVVITNDGLDRKALCGPAGTPPNLYYRKPGKPYAPPHDPCDEKNNATVPADCQYKDSKCPHKTSHKDDSKHKKPYETPSPCDPYKEGKCHYKEGPKPHHKEPHKKPCDPHKDAKCSYREGHERY